LRSRAPLSAASASTSLRPSRAICSTLIAEAFQTIDYPILPPIEDIASGPSVGSQRAREVAHIRHHSLFVPRDFDISPYFRVVKPAIQAGFNYHLVKWAAKSGGLESVQGGLFGQTLHAAQPESS
jgi:hypothetical protein